MLPLEFRGGGGISRAGKLNWHTKQKPSPGCSRSGQGPPGARTPASSAKGASGIRGHVGEPQSADPPPIKTFSRTPRPCRRHWSAGLRGQSASRLPPESTASLSVGGRAAADPRLHRLEAPGAARGRRPLPKSAHSPTPAATRRSGD